MSENIQEEYQMERKELKWC